MYYYNERGKNENIETNIDQLKRGKEADRRDPK